MDVVELNFVADVLVHHATAVGGVVVVADGGGMSIVSSFRFLPFGAGSSGGDRLYVTVRVTTDRTLTGLLHALRGVSKYLREALSRLQSAGEKGEYARPAEETLLKPVRGEGPHVVGEYAGE